MTPNVFNFNTWPFDRKNQRNLTKAAPRYGAVFSPPKQSNFDATIPVRTLIRAWRFEPRLSERSEGCTKVRIGLRNECRAVPNYGF